MPYWILDKKTNTPGLFKNRKELEKAFEGRIKKANLNYHFSVCKKVEVVIDEIWIVRFK